MKNMVYTLDCGRLETFSDMTDYCLHAYQWMAGEKRWIRYGNEYQLVTVHENGTFTIEETLKRWKPDNISIAKDYGFHLQYSNVCGFAFGVNEGFLDIPTDNRYLCEAITLRERAKQMQLPDHVNHLNTVIGFLSSCLTVEN